MDRKHVLAYVGVGANLGDPTATVRSALAALDGLPGSQLARVSGLYRTPPLGPPDQPDFINAVAALRTILGPWRLLAALQSLEHGYGRRRDGMRWGPRTLDLDILLYGDWRIREAGLTIPHPGLRRRAFVLCPLHEIAPNAEIPGHGPVRALLAGVAGEPIEKV